MKDVLLFQQILANFRKKLGYDMATCLKEQNIYFKGIL
jgi:hypothetical protein